MYMYVDFKNSKSTNHDSWVYTKLGMYTIVFLTQKQYCTLVSTENIKKRNFIDDTTITVTLIV